MSRDKAKDCRKTQLFFLFLPFFMVSTCFASGYQHFELTAGALGNLAAGAGTDTADASILFYNPAGLVYFDNREVSYSTNFLKNNVNYTGYSIWTPIPNPLLLNHQEFGTAKTNQLEILPAFNEAIPLTSRIALGLGVEFPYGYHTDYSSTGVLRYLTTSSNLLVLDLTPNLAVRLTPKWAIGVGLDADYAHANFDQMIGDPVINPALDSTSTNEGHGWGFGGHTGIIYQYDPATMFGLTYHSPISIKIHGQSKLEGPLSSPTSSLITSSSEFATTIKLPDFVDFSVFHQLNQRFDVLASVDYTRWSSLNSLELQSQVSGANNRLPFVTTGIISQDLHDSFRVALGGNFHFLQQWVWRVGMSLDQTPYSDGQVSVLNPDNDTASLGTGLGYTLNSLFSFDVGYVHRFYFGKQEAHQSNLVSNTQNSFLVGTVKQRADEIGAQINWNIGKLTAVTT